MEHCTSIATDSARAASVVGSLSVDWLALHLCTLGQPIRAHELIAHYHTPANIFHASRAALEMCHDAPLADAQWAAIGGLRFAVDWSEIAQLQHRITTMMAQKTLTIIPYTAPEYPALLRHIADPPLLLFVRGAIAALRAPAVAIVGTRKPTRYGREMADALTAALVARGLTIISGLAFGIDATAHRRALDARGCTVGVLASGVDDITPRSHYTLGEQIVRSGGALMSEYPPGTPSYAGHYPQRNRIISGLCAATIIIECTKASGTMWTAKHALDQNRALFALPGQVDCELAAGPNFLLAQGATPIVDVETAATQIAKGVRRVTDQL